jgi:hypothetical protein
VTPLNAQQVILNTRGEKIVVYPDGSWRYYEAADSALLNKKLLKEDIPATDENTPPIIERVSTNPAADADISSLAVRFAQRIGSETDKAREQLSDAVSDKFEVEGRLEQAQANKKLIEPDFISALEDAFEAKRIAVKEAQKHLKTLDKIDRKAQDVLNLPVSKKPKALNNLIARYESYGVKTGLSGSSQPVYADHRKTGKSTPEVSRGGRTETISVKSPRQSSEKTKTIVYQRAPVPCRLQRGDASMRNGIAVEKGLMFTHTDEDLRPYFRQQELVSCFASLHQIEDNTWLTLEFQISSPDARKNFGILENKSLLRFKLINGAFISLSNARTDQGKLDAYTGNTIYTGNYLIDKETEKSLTRHELDKIRVVWSSGFEDYDIVNVDFLINQFNCLRSGVN